MVYQAAMRRIIRGCPCAFAWTPLDLDGIGIVDNPVTDGVSLGRVVQVFVPLAGIILGTEDSGGYIVPGLYQFQHIPGLCLLEGVKQLFIVTAQ